MKPCQDADECFGCYSNSNHICLSCIQMNICKGYTKEVIDKGRKNREMKVKTIYKCFHCLSENVIIPMGCGFFKCDDCGNRWLNYELGIIEED